MCGAVQVAGNAVWNCNATDCVYFCRPSKAGEYLELAEQSAGTKRDLSLKRIRVRTHENPYAKVPLDRRLFLGPFDERYGEIEDTGRWGRVYVGRGVAEFEEKSDAASLLSRS